MNEPVELSKQQKKSKETKERIFQAAKRILQKSGYEALSIKNICEEAGVSNGSFYHHFKTKDDLLSYYIEDQPSIDPDRLELPKNKEDAKETIIHVYLNYVKYCKELGVEFMAGYYTPHNHALEANAIQLNLKIEEITTDIRMIVIGNVFEWSMRNGKADFESNMKRSLSHYLDSIFVV